MDTRLRRRYAIPQPKSMTDEQSTIDSLIHADIHATCTVLENRRDHGADHQEIELIECLYDEVLSPTVLMSRADEERDDIEERRH